MTPTKLEVPLMPCSACSSDCSSDPSCSSQGGAGLAITDPKLLLADYQHPELVERMKNKLKLSDEEALLRFEDVKKYLFRVL